MCDIEYGNLSCQAKFEDSEDLLYWIQGGGHGLGASITVAIPPAVACTSDSSDFMRHTRRCGDANFPLVWERTDGHIEQGSSTKWVPWDTGKSQLYILAPDVDKVGSAIVDPSIRGDAATRALVNFLACVDSFTPT